MVLKCINKNSRYKQFEKLIIFNWPPPPVQDQNSTSITLKF